MVLTGIAILKEEPNPTKQHIKEALHGNYCRCTGYIKIMDAIELASQRMAAQAGKKEKRGKSKKNQ
jgi:carbon-monoxide dehydrogenase small subunit